MWLWLWLYRPIRVTKTHKLHSKRVHITNRLVFWQLQTVETSRLVDDVLFALERQRPQSMSRFRLFPVTAIFLHYFDVVRQRTLLHYSLFVAVIRRQFVDHLSIKDNSQRSVFCVVTSAAPPPLQKKSVNRNFRASIGPPFDGLLRFVTIRHELKREN